MWKTDWWLTPEGTFEMGAHEHVVMALQAMLRLDTSTPIPQEWAFSKVPDKVLKAAKKRGAPAADLEYLSRESNDPRTYMIVKYGWIRVSKGKFNMNEFDQDALDLIQNAKELWDFEQPEEYEMAEIDELKGDATFSVSVSKLRRRGASPEALKNLGKGVGMYRNPEEFYLLAKFGQKWKVFSVHGGMEDAMDAMAEIDDGKRHLRIVTKEDPVVREYLGE